MSLTWNCESPAYWDKEKARIVGGVEAGALDFEAPAEGAVLPGVWWRVEQDGYVVAYGWMDVVWGEAEILLAVDDVARSIGVGGMVLDLLEAEAAERGLSYLYNTVPKGHPDREATTRWLSSRGFYQSADEERLVRCVRGAARKAA